MWGFLFLLMQAYEVVYPWFAETAARLAPDTDTRGHISQTLEERGKIVVDALREGLAEFCENMRAWLARSVRFVDRITDGAVTSIKIKIGEFLSYQDWAESENHFGPGGKDHVEGGYLRREFTNLFNAFYDLARSWGFFSDNPDNDVNELRKEIAVDIKSGLSDLAVSEESDDKASDPEGKPKEGFFAACKRFLGVRNKEEQEPTDLRDTLCDKSVPNVLPEADKSLDKSKGGNEKKILLDMETGIKRRRSAEFSTRERLSDDDVGSESEFSYEDPSKEMPHRSSKSQDASDHSMYNLGQSEKPIEGDSHVKLSTVDENMDFYTRRGTLSV